MDKYFSIIRNSIKLFIFALLLLMLTKGSSEYGFDSAITCSSNMKQSRKGRTQILAAIPCDLTMQAYCALPGTSYPWQAVRRFVHENQGLMKRMYGDLRHIAILRDEMLNNEIDINDIESASKRYSRSGFHRSSKHIENIVNDNNDNYHNIDQLSNIRSDLENNPYSIHHKNLQNDYNSISLNDHHTVSNEHHNYQHDGNYVKLNEMVKSPQLQSFQTTSEIKTRNITTGNSSIRNATTNNLSTAQDFDVANLQMNSIPSTTTFVSSTTVQASNATTATNDNITNAVKDIQCQPTTKLKTTFETNADNTTDFYSATNEAIKTEINSIFQTVDNLQTFQSKNDFISSSNNSQIVQISPYDLQTQTTNINAPLNVNPKDNQNSQVKATSAVVTPSNPPVISTTHVQFINSIPMLNSIQALTTPQPSEPLIIKSTTVKTETVAERAPSKPHKNIIQLFNRQRRPSQHLFKINSTISAKLKLKLQNIDPIFTNSATKDATSSSFIPNIESILGTKFSSFKFNKNHSRYNSHLSSNHKHTADGSNSDKNAYNRNNSHNITFSTNPYNTAQHSNTEVLHNEEINRPSIALSPTSTAANLVTSNTKNSVHESQLFQDTMRNEPTLDVINLRGINACPVKEEVVAPFWANNTRGEVLALLNLYPFEQYVHWEKCTHENRQMYCREGCRCEQQYRLHRLLAYDPHNECRGIFSDWFRFPSCCICKCYNIPLDFRTTSRSPRSDSGIRDTSNGINDKFDKLEYRLHPIDLAEQQLKNAIYNHAEKSWYRPTDELSYV